MADQMVYPEQHEAALYRIRELEAALTKIASPGEHRERIAELEAKLRLTEGAFKNTRIRELEAALRWAVEWVPNPAECSPEPSADIQRIIYEFGTEP